MQVEAAEEQPLISLQLAGVAEGWDGRCALFGRLTHPIPLSIHHTNTEAFVPHLEYVPQGLENGRHSCRAISGTHPVLFSTAITHLSFLISRLPLPLPLTLPCTEKPGPTPDLAQSKPRDTRQRCPCPSLPSARRQAQRQQSQDQTHNSQASPASGTEPRPCSDCTKSFHSDLSTRPISHLPLQLV